MKADESADCAVLCVAWQRTGLRNRLFYRSKLSKRIRNNSELQLKYGVEDIEVNRIKMDYGLINDISAFYMELSALLGTVK